MLSNNQGKVLHEDPLISVFCGVRKCVAQKDHNNTAIRPSVVPIIGPDKRLRDMLTHMIKLSVENPKNDYVLKFDQPKA